MKKMLPALLALALLLSACGGPAAEVTPTPAPEPAPTRTAEPVPTPEPTPSGPAVYTDWSKLEPYEPVQAVYTRRYEDFTDTLIPSEDYGPLVPFAGAALTETWEGWSSDYNLYGLMTLEGEVVADPVFMSVLRLTEYDSEYNPVYRPDVMLLGKVFYDAEGQPGERYALCAGDGSWCTDFLYEYPWEMDMGISFSQGIPLLDREERLVFLDQDTGVELRALDLTAQAGGEDFSLSSFQVDPKTGWVLVSLYRWEEESGGENLSLLFDPDGQAHPLPREVQWAYQYGDGLVPAAVEMDTGLTTEYRYGYVDALTGAWAIEPGFIQARTFENAVALVQEQSGAWRFIDPTGAPLTEPIEADSYWETGGYWYFISYAGRALAVYDRMGKPVEGIQNLATGEMETRMGGWVTAPAGEELLLAKGLLIYRFPAALGWVNGVCEEGILFCAPVEGEKYRVNAVLADWDGKELFRWENCSYAYLAQDELTGEYYLSVTWEEGERSYADHYDLSGELLASDRGKRDGYYTFWNGMACWNGGEETTFTDREGNVIFRWPIYSSMD